MIIDSHTHHDRPGAVVNIDPTMLGKANPELLADRRYSVGIHPWNAPLATEHTFTRLSNLALRPEVVAIGECGLDTVHESYRRDSRGDIVQSVPDLGLQESVLMQHILLSERLCKPLVLHVVKRFPEIMRLRNKLRPAMPWVIHGFRGKPGLAAQLVKAGFYLSYGEHFNEQSVLATPPERILVETDESPLTLGEIVSKLPASPEARLFDFLNEGGTQANP